MGKPELVLAPFFAHLSPQVGVVGEGELDGRDRPGRTHGEPWACPVYMCISYMHAVALHIGHALVSSYVPNGHALFCEAAGPKCI